MNRRLLIGISVGALLLGGSLATAQAFRGGFGGGGNAPDAAAPFLGRGVQFPVTVDVYDIDPNSAGATLLATVTLEEGDSLASVLEQYPDAAFVVVRGDFARTIDVAALEQAEQLRERAQNSDRRGFGRDVGRRDVDRRDVRRRGFGPSDVGPRGFGPADSARGIHLPFVGPLADGATVTVTFYDANPAEGGTVTETLSFVVGSDDRAAFVEAFEAAAADAAYIEVDVDGNAVPLP